MITHHRFPEIVVHQIGLHGIPGRGNSPIAVRCSMRCLETTGQVLYVQCSLAGDAFFTSQFKKRKTLKKSIENASRRKY